MRFKLEITLDNAAFDTGNDETTEEIMARMERECSYAPSQMKRVI